MIKFLYWYSPILSALIMILHIIENFLRYPTTPMLFYYSFCKKSPFPSDLIDDAMTFKIFVTIVITPSLIAEMCIHIAVLVKQTKTENNATVYIIKNDQRVSRQRHQRNVISLLGHFVSFAVNSAEAALFLHANYISSDGGSAKGLLKYDIRN